ncbi:hypothetical protein BHE90_007055 [Fusarium euwallaceae]|uniref:Mid2 domain-containing protein n=1 Tax=Fusarium euwallaceae TaxID=1147111 RepID=A0A430LRV8_9HYPO|nr:hypothetical protein BHE90_007055 [Fusarium euwallaceae]
MTSQVPALTTTFKPAKTCSQYYKYRYTGDKVQCLDNSGEPSAFRHQVVRRERHAVQAHSLVKQRQVGLGTQLICTIVIPDTVEVIYSVSTVGGDWEKSTAKGAAANAIGIPIRWHSSDFASTTSDTSAAEASGTSGTSESGTAETGSATETSSPSGGGLSTGAKAGIGVGVGVAALAGLGALLWFVLRARRAKQAAGAGGEGFKEPQQQQQQAWELDSYQPIPPAELPTESAGHGGNRT